MRIAPDSPATPGLAMSTSFEPVVRFWPEPEPSARFELPLVLASRALVPVATLSLPVLLE